LQKSPIKRDDILQKRPIYNWLSYFMSHDMKYIQQKISITIHFSCRTAHSIAIYPIRHVTQLFHAWQEPHQKKNHLWGLPTAHGTTIYFHTIYGASYTHSRWLTKPKSKQKKTPQSILWRGLRTTRPRNLQHSTSKQLSEVSSLPNLLPNHSPPNLLYENGYRAEF